MTERAEAGFAPAKINLSLKILGRQVDGYHCLDSLVAFADIGDRVKVAPAATPGITLNITGPYAAALSPSDPADNLVVRAAKALGAAAGITPAITLTLEKNLPVASGIGGGSADAAAVLRVLCAAWGLDWGADRLAALALPLGADVPVCLASRCVWMGGVGQQLAPAPALPNDPAPGLLLVNPGVATSTGAVFQALAGRFSKPAARPSCLGPDLADLVAAIRPLGNDLTESAIAVTPVIMDVLAALEPMDGVAYAALSGSGATCFALLPSRAEAVAAAEVLRARAPDGWWIAAAGGLI